MVAVLTHGINGRLYSTDGELIAVEEVTKYYDGLNCPSLIGKPKVFILQACRGGRFDYGVEMESTDAPNAPEVKPDEMKEIVEQQVTVRVCTRIVITVESLGSTGGHPLFRSLVPPVPHHHQQGFG